MPSKKIISIALLLCGCAGIPNAQEHDRSRRRAEEQRRETQAARVRWQPAAAQARREHEARAVREYEEAHAAELAEEQRIVDEIQRDAFVEQRAADEARRQRELEEQDRVAQVTAEARRHGFKRVLCGESLVAVLEQIVATPMPTEHLDGVAVELGDADQTFTALQILDKKRALFISSESDVRIILKGYRGVLYEGTSLTALRVTMVRVAGTVVYPTRAGSAQAFVVEPAR
jgi:hypothetical protein